MSLRAVALIVALMLVAGVSAYVALHNQTTLMMPVSFFGGYRLPVYALVAWAFVAGFALTSSLVLVRSGVVAYGRFKEAREAKARARLEKQYAQGLEALLGGNSERAEACFRDVLFREPEHVETLLTYGEMLRGIGRPREAADLHRRASELRPGDVRPRFALAADWNAAGDADEARAALERIVAENPRASLRARREIRDLLVDARRWEGAFRAHEAIEAQTPDGPARERERRVGLGIRYEMARADQARGDLRAAEKQYRAILKADPGFIPASLALGDALVAQGDALDAAKVWRRGYETTQSPIFFARFEEHHLSREEPEVVIQLMRALVESSRSRVVPAFYLAKLYLRLEMIDEAESTFSELEGLVAESPIVRYYAGMVLERRGRYKEALECYRQVVRSSGMLRPRYLCRGCKATLDEPSARCPRCGDWNTIDVDVRDLVPAGEPGSAPPPEWAAGA